MRSFRPARKSGKHSNKHAHRKTCQALFFFLLILRTTTTKNKHLKCLWGESPTKKKKKGSTLMIQVSWNEMWETWNRYRTPSKRVATLCKTKCGRFWKCGSWKVLPARTHFISVVVCFAKFQTSPKPHIAGRGDGGVSSCLSPSRTN